MVLTRSSGFQRVGCPPSKKIATDNRQRHGIDRPTEDDNTTRLMLLTKRSWLVAGSNSLGKLLLILAPVACVSIHVRVAVETDVS